MVSASHCGGRISRGSRGLFFEDAEGNLWAGVNRGGLVRLRKKAVSKFSAAPKARNRSACIPSAKMRMALMAGHRWQWLGRWQNEKYSRTPTSAAMSQRLPRQEWRTLAEHGDEDLYVLLRGRVERWCSVYPRRQINPASRDGRTVWAGTKIGLFACGNMASRNFSPLAGFPLHQRRARTLQESADGVLWAGGGDGVLYRVSTNGVESINPNAGGARYPIWSLLADTDGTIWAGTFRGGLLRYRNGKFDRFHLEWIAGQRHCPASVGR